MDENGIHSIAMLFPDDGLIIPSSFQIMSRYPPGTKNNTSKDILCEYKYQETLG